MAPLRSLSLHVALVVCCLAVSTSANWCDALQGQCVDLAACPASMTDSGTIPCSGNGRCCIGTVPCGKVPPAARLFADGPATPCSHPWQVSLRRSLVPANDTLDMLDLANSRHQCAGVLVHSNWVLTTAVCALEALQPLSDLTKGVLVASDHDVTVEEGKEQLRLAKSVMIYDQFPDSAATQMSEVDFNTIGQNDFALIEVEDAFSAYGAEDCASIVCLPEAGDALNCTTPAKIHGWGMDEEYMPASTPKTFNVNVWLQETCNAFGLALDPSAFVNPFHENNICYTVDPPSNTTAVPCQGDSGGAVVYEKDDGSHVLYGLLQSKLPCDKKHSHVIGDVYKVVEWIKTTIGA